jgi:hypothetical protein
MVDLGDDLRLLAISNHPFPAIHGDTIRTTRV